MAIFFGAYSSEEFVCEFDKYGNRDEMDWIECPRSNKMIENNFHQCYDNFTERLMESKKKYLVFVCLFVTEEIQYHGGLRSRELGQAPIQTTLFS